MNYKNTQKTRNNEQNESSTKRNEKKQKTGIQEMKNTVSKLKISKRPSTETPPCRRKNQQSRSNNI